MKRLTFLVAMVVMIAACNPYGSRIPQNLVGSWLSERDGAWEYGFYEEFAIFDNDFWQYQSVNENKIVLHNKGARPEAGGSESITLNVNILSDTSITVNGKNYFRFDNAEYMDSDDYQDMQKFAAKYLASMSYFPDIKEDTADFAPYRYLRDDSATIVYYNRNTAHGISTLMNRYEFGRKVHYIDINRLNDNGFIGIGASPVDSTEHYGDRMVYRVPCESVSEVDGGNLMQNWGSGIYLPVPIEPDDTLTFLMSREHLNGLTPHVCGHYSMGGNARYMRERDLFCNFLVSKGITYFNNHELAHSHDYYGAPSVNLDSLQFAERYQQFVTDTTLLNEFLAQSKMPVSKKFVHYNKNVLLYRFAHDVAWLASAEDFFKQNPQLLDEQEVLLSRWGMSFAMEYIRREDSKRRTEGNTMDTNALPISMKESIAQHPNFVLCKSSRGGRCLIDPNFVKDLGFSDQFVELLRYEYFDRYGQYVIDLHDNPLSSYYFIDYEKQHFLNTVKSDKYRREMDDVFANSGDHNLSDFLKEYRGEVVMVLFWSAQFEEDFTTMQQLKPTFEEYKSKGVECVFITSKSSTSTKQFEQVKGSIPGHHFILDKKQYCDMFGYLYPSTYAIVGKGGELLAYYVGFSGEEIFHDVIEPELRMATGD